MQSNMKWKCKLQGAGSGVRVLRDTGSETQHSFRRDQRAARFGRKPNVCSLLWEVRKQACSLPGYQAASVHP